MFDLAMFPMYEDKHKISESISLPLRPLKQRTPVFSTVIVLIDNHLVSQLNGLEATIKCS